MPDELGIERVRGDMSSAFQAVRCVHCVSAAKQGAVLQLFGKVLPSQGKIEQKIYTADAAAMREETQRIAVAVLRGGSRQGSTSATRVVPAQEQQAPGERTRFATGHGGGRGSGRGGPQLNTQQPTARATQQPQMSGLSYPGDAAGATRPGAWPA